MSPPSRGPRQGRREWLDPPVTFVMAAEVMKVRSDQLVPVGQRQVGLVALGAPGDSGSARIGYAQFGSLGDTH